jgi:hypothetical protein
MLAMMKHHQAIDKTTSVPVHRSPQARLQAKFREERSVSLTCGDAETVVSGVVAKKDWVWNHLTHI